MKASEVLTEARRRLLEDGWIQGKYQDDNGLCAAGAVLVSQGHAAVFNDMHWRENPALNLLQELCPSTPSRAGLTFWNDDPKTTFNDVMELFDKAIIVAKSREA